MIFEIIRLIAGLALVMFLPGYLLSRIIFQEISLPGRISLSCGLSVTITVAMGFFLTFIGNALGIKTITPWGAALSLTAVCIVFLAILMMGSNKNQSIAGRKFGADDGSRRLKGEKKGSSHDRIVLSNIGHIRIRDTR